MDIGRLSEFCNLINLVKKCLYRVIDKQIESANIQGIKTNPFVSVDAREIDELAQHMKHVDIELIQIGRTTFPSNLSQLTFENINLQVGHYGAAYISNATMDKGRCGLIFKTNTDYSTRCNGYEINSSQYMYYGKNSEHIAINRGPCRWIYISQEPYCLEEYVLDSLNVKPDARNGVTSCLRCEKQASLENLYGVVNEIIELVNSNPRIIQNADIVKGMERSILDSQLLIISNTFNPSVKQTERGKKSHERIIRQSNDFLEIISYKPIHLMDLCNALNVGVRTLYYAFNEYYGISPIKYLRLLRYSKARRDLVNSDSERTSVTDIAAKWHFWHFGRFSVEYKSLYGESPSETLYKVTLRVS